MTTPSYLQLKEALSSEIENIPPGGRLPSIRSLMKTYGVSQGTVERALFELEKKAVLERSPGRGIFKKDKSKSIKHLISVLVNDPSDKSTSFFLKGLLNKLNEKEFNLQVLNYTSSIDKKIVEKLRRDGPDGLIIYNNAELVSNPRNVDCLTRLNSDFKSIFVETPNPYVLSKFIGASNYNAGYNCADDFLQRGSGCIAIFWDSRTFVGQERVNGFLARLEKEGLEVDFKKVSLFDVNEFLITRKVKTITWKKNMSVFNANPPYLIDVLAELKREKLKIGSDLILASIVEEDYKDIIRDPVICYVKPSCEIGSRCGDALIADILENSGDLSTERLEFTKVDLSSN